MVESTDSRTKWSIFNNPIPLLEISNKRILSAIDSYLPFSVGMEIECMHGTVFKEENFVSIPNIMAVDNANPEYEQRYRIPSGLKGLVCLWQICEQLKLNCKYHPHSGHHYHIDCVDVWDRMPNGLINKNLDWILPELDTWKYSGTYNKRDHGWIRPNGLKTIEFRCADMTFEYPIIIKRLISASNIVRKLKIQCLKHPKYQELENLNLELQKLERQQEEAILANIVISDVAEQVVKSRSKRV